jgi:hypothetical protein
MRLGEWDEILRYAQDDRRGRRVKRGFAGVGQRLEIVRRRRRRKQVPHYARNDNLGEFARVGEVCSKSCGTAGTGRLLLDIMRSQ